MIMFILCDLQGESGPAGVDGAPGRMGDDVSSVSSLKTTTTVCFVFTLMLNHCSDGSQTLVDGLHHYHS